MTSSSDQLRAQHDALHLAYRWFAFFEAPGQPFEFKDQHDYDLHIALEVTPEALQEMFDKGKAEGIDTRGVADHEFVHSIYFRDPAGNSLECAEPKLWNL